MTTIGLDLLCLTPLSAIFQLYHGFMTTMLINHWDTFAE